ncbi:hypothetical protein [Anabaena lutea]|nr:hypothetical protein [Anabaena lutea]
MLVNQGLSSPYLIRNGFGLLYNDHNGNSLMGKVGAIAPLSSLRSRRVS